MGFRKNLFQGGGAVIIGDETNEGNMEMATTEELERLVAEGWVRQTDDRFRPYPGDVVYRKVWPSGLMQEITVPPSKEFEDKWMLSRYFDNEFGTEYDYEDSFERDSLDDVLATAAEIYPR